MPVSPWGGATTVDTLFSHSGQVVPLSTGGFVVVWTRFNATNEASDVYFQRFDGAGNSIGEPTPVEIAENNQSPAAYATATGFVVILTQGGQFGDFADADAMFYRFSNAGLLEATQIIAGSAGSETGAVGVAASVYINAYILGNEDVGADVQIRTFNQDFSNSTLSTIALSGMDRELAIGQIADRTIVAWWNELSGLVAQAVDQNGVLIGAPFIIAGDPDLAYYDISITALESGYAVGYTELATGPLSSRYCVRLYDADGAANGPALYIESDHEGSVRKGEVVKYGSGFLVVYNVGETYSGPSGNIDIMGQAFDADGVLVGSEFSIATGVNTEQLGGVTVLGDGRVVVVFSDAGVTRFQILDPRDGVVNGTGSQDQLYGSDLQNDHIIAGNGNDFLYGLGGDDLMDGGKGADRMNGGLGDDTYIVDNVGDVVIEAADGGYDIVRSSVSFNASVASLAAIEEIVLTGAGAISATGNALNNVLVGNIAANVLDGKAGADIMSGGDGGDIYYVDNIGDVVVEASGTASGTDIIYSSVSYTLAGRFVETLILTGSDALNATGNSVANTLIGNSGANILTGGYGADVMTGHDGDDTYYVDNVGDVVNEASMSGGAADRIFSSVSYSLSGRYVETLTLTGSAAIDAIGNASANTLNGNAGANVLSGGGGADRLIGGLGADTLAGNAGNDVFVYKATAESSVSAFDHITDLTAGDKIDLSAIDANTIAGGNQAFAIANAFTQVAGQMTLKYASATNLTTILMDVNGDGVADMKITATGDQHAFTNFLF